MPEKRGRAAPSRMGWASQKPQAAGAGRAPNIFPQRAPALQSKAQCGRRTAPTSERGARRRRAPWGRGPFPARALSPQPRTMSLARLHPDLPLRPGPGPRPRPTPSAHRGAAAAAAEAPAQPPPRLGHRRRRFLPPRRAPGLEVSGFSPPSPASLLPRASHQHADPGKRRPSNFAAPAPRLPHARPGPSGPQSPEPPPSAPHRPAPRGSRRPSPPAPLPSRPSARPPSRLLLSHFFPRTASAAALCLALTLSARPTFLLKTFVVPNSGLPCSRSCVPVPAAGTSPFPCLSASHRHFQILPAGSAQSHSPPSVPPWKILVSPLLLTFHSSSRRARASICVLPGSVPGSVNTTVNPPRGVGSGRKQVFTLLPCTPSEPKGQGAVITKQRAGAVS